MNTRPRVTIGAKTHEHNDVIMQYQQKIRARRRHQAAEQLMNSRAATCTTRTMLPGSLRAFGPDPAVLPVL